MVFDIECKFLSLILDIEKKSGEKEENDENKKQKEEEEEFRYLVDCYRLMYI